MLIIRLILILLIYWTPYSDAFVASTKTKCYSTSSNTTTRTVLYRRPYELLLHMSIDSEDVISKDKDVAKETKWQYLNFKLTSRTILILSLILPLVVESLWVRKAASSVLGISLARICSNYMFQRNQNSPKLESNTLDTSGDLDRKKQQQMSVRKRFLGGIGVRKILADLEEQDRRIEQINREILQAREKERIEEGKQWAIKSINSTKEAQRKAQERLRKEEADRRKAKAWAASVTKTSGVDLTRD